MLAVSHDQTIRIWTGGDQLANGEAKRYTLLPNGRLQKSTSDIGQEL